MSGRGRSGNLLAAHRHAAITRRVDRQGVASVADLAAELAVSRETIRRDLRALAAAGRLRPVHGGAAILQPAEPTLDRRAAINAAGKRAIARVAAALVRDGATLIIDSGTTTTALADALRARRRLIVYTNSLDVAQRLAAIDSNRVVVLGGELQPHDRSTVGWDTVNALLQYRAEIAFVGVGAISDEPWLTDYSRAGAELRARMLVAAGQVVVLADRSKFGRITPVRVPNFDKAHRLITDRAPDPAIARGLRRLGIAMTVA